MSVTPEITVVMANYNGARYLGAAIRSLQAQTLESWELILVDDASQDESVQLASAFSNSDSRVKVVQQTTNQGPSAARNMALRLARGQWMAVFDSDDLMRPRRLQILRDRAKSDGALIVADNLLVFVERSQLTKPFLPARYTAAPRWIGLAEYVDSNRLYSQTPDLGYLKPLINLDLLRRSGIVYDERLRVGEDYEIIARLLAAGLRLRLEPSGQYLYRKHSNSLSHRIHRDEIVALIKANHRLTRDIHPMLPEVARALQRRERSLISMLDYDRVISMLKTGRYGGAFAASLAAPHIWPLLTRPVRARIGRVIRQIQRAYIAPRTVPRTADSS